MENTMKDQLKSQMTEMEKQIEALKFTKKNCELAREMTGKDTNVTIEVTYNRFLAVNKNYSKIEVELTNQVLIHLSLNAQISENEKKIQRLEKSISAYKDELNKIEN